MNIRLKGIGANITTRPDRLIHTANYTRENFSSNINVLSHKMNIEEGKETRTELV